MAVPRCSSTLNKTMKTNEVRERGLALAREALIRSGEPSYFADQAVGQARSGAKRQQVREWAYNIMGEVEGREDLRSL